jgi:ribonuclease R
LRRASIRFCSSHDRRFNDDIFVLKKDFNDARTGDKVVVKITKYPDKGNSAEGKVEEIISRRGEVGGDIKALIRQYNLKQEFSEKVEAEAKKIPLKIPEEETKRGRSKDKTIITMTSRCEGS